MLRSYECCDKLRDPCLDVGHSEEDFLRGLTVFDEQHDYAGTTPPGLVQRVD